MSGIIDISPELHAGIAVWPGDVTFIRRVSFDTAKGDHLTLSSMETTVHVGAHTDAPNHFGGSSGISEVALDAYWGKCQVIAVEKRLGSGIDPAQLNKIRVEAPRILFKTQSFPNPDFFNTDFMALTPELVHFLADQGVILVGIDTPSIDLCESKDLPSHHAVLERKLSILEGIVLSSVSPGLYELCALPLKIRGADASPVRAVLRAHKNI